MSFSIPVLFEKSILIAFLPLVWKSSWKLKKINMYGWLLLKIGLSIICATSYRNVTRALMCIATVMKRKMETLVMQQRNLVKVLRKVPDWCRCLWKDMSYYISYWIKTAINWTKKIAKFCECLQKEPLYFNAFFVIFDQIW